MEVFVLTILGICSDFGYLNSWGFAGDSALRFARDRRSVGQMRLLARTKHIARSLSAKPQAANHNKIFSNLEFGWAIF